MKIAFVGKGGSGKTTLAGLFLRQLHADGVFLFCSPESNYISGQVITVGGGISF